MYDPVEYFDEMNLLQSDKNRRTETAEKFINKLVNFLEAQFMNLLNGLFGNEKTTREYEDELMDIYLTFVTDPTDREAINKARRFSQYIEDTTETAVRGANGNENYANGILFGLKMKREDVPDSVARVFSKERATQIALDETNWIYNYANHKEYVENGQLTHTWLTKRDERVRDTHAAADGQTVPINEPFLINGYKMLFPMDDSYGAPASEICSCRCVEI